LWICDLERRKPAENREIIYETVAQTEYRINYSQLLKVVKFVSVANEREGNSHVVYMFFVGFFPHFIKILRATFPPHRTSHLQPLNVTVMRPLTAKYAVTQNDWMMASAHPVSFIMKNILAGFENSGLWSFSRNTFS
jgi:hypothetical protein